jgi:hypothetical protein
MRLWGDWDQFGKFEILDLVRGWGLIWVDKELEWVLWSNLDWYFGWIEKEEGY